MNDWVVWHGAYDDPSSPLARRLKVVRARLAAVLATAGAGARLLSLCAGEGRDVLPVLAASGAPVTAVLVESDPELCRRAADSAASAGLRTVAVRCADAGDPASFRDVLPVDVLLLCGIFGNVAHDRVHDVVDAVPAMLTDGGHVIWTRGASEPDRRPEVRRWFRAAGLVEVAFDGAPEPFGVGVNRRAPRRPDTTPPLPDRLFEFLPHR